MSDFQHLTAIVEEASYVQSTEQESEKSESETSLNAAFVNEDKFDHVKIFIQESDQKLISDHHIPDSPENNSPPEPNDQYLAPDPDHVRKVSGRRRMSLSGGSLGWGGTKASGSQSSLTDVHRI